MNISRRTFLAACTGILASGGAAGWYMRHVEPRWLRTRHRTVQLRTSIQFEQPIRLAHLSDFHLSDVVPLSMINKAIEDVVEQAPDLICLTGDFVTSKIDTRHEYVRTLRKLSATTHTVAVLGNHDGGAWARINRGYSDTRNIEELLHLAGITCLKNQNMTVQVKGQELELVGLGDMYSGECLPGTAFPKKESTRPRILLSHNPDSKDEVRDYAWDLMLCGHTHGGQLSLPVIGTPFAPVKDHGYVYGLKCWEGRYIHVTSGVGNLRGLRLNCRPEIVMISIT